MTHPFESELLAGFPDRLEQCTSEEWEVTLKHLIWRLLIELGRGKEMPDEGKKWLERLLDVLKRGPNPRQIGRPRLVKQAECDFEIFEMLGAESVPAKVKVLKRAYEMRKVMRTTQPTLSLMSLMSLKSELPYHTPKSCDVPENEATVIPSDDALRKRAARAARAGHQFETGARFGKRRKKP